MKEKDKRIAELKQNDEAKNSVISAKDKLIDVLKQNDAVKDKRNGDLTQQILNSVDVRQLNKLFKYVDRAEATSCLPFDNSNDIQTIRVPGIESFRVPCDSTFAGSGWTVVQRRQDGSVNFKRNWDQYKNGFGDLRNEFWLGLEKVHLMTKFQSHELFVQLEDFNHETRYARYSNFSIASESRSYELLTQCLLSVESDGDCTRYCYKVVQQLLQYFRVSSAKLDQFETLQAKIHEQELYIKKLEATPKVQEETLEKIQELQTKIDEQQILTKTVQTKLDEQQAALKQNVKNSIINEKDNLIADLKQQILDSVDVRQLTKVFKYVDRAEATSCLPFDNSNDIQTIRVPGIESFRVPCDSTFAGSGWTVVQRRQDGSVDFNRTWDEYKNGFGDLRGEFWLGLEKLHLMTKFQSHELYIQLEDFNHEKRYARYSNFSIASESRFFELLTVGAYRGNAGNALDYWPKNKGLRAIVNIEICNCRS
ncbi:angiopoietin-2-like [Drosophila busckii]|uniref:angiopoietin-2-like n=1 Tax=Drosophila busckii TaxID=30019 RepID=UPI0014332513|nr:angiopoietin-2-like [Drosophila busckii]